MLLKLYHLPLWQILYIWMVRWAFSFEKEKINPFENAGFEYVDGYEMCDKVGMARGLSL